MASGAERDVSQLRRSVKLSNKLVKQGSILLDNNFRFKNGNVNKKLLVVINSPAQKDPYIVVTVTSQQHSKPKSTGCIPEKYHKVFFIPKNTTFFEKDTWVQLNDFYILPKELAEKRLERKGCLPEKITQGVVDCFLKINKDDLPPKVHNYIVSPIKQGRFSLRYFSCRCWISLRKEMESSAFLNITSRASI